MAENIKESMRIAVGTVFVILSGLAGIWWGLRMGAGLLLTGAPDLRPFLCVLMSAGLLFQGYSNLKTDRKYSSGYRIALWTSGILVSLLIYGLLFMVPMDIVVFIVRHAAGLSSSFRGGTGSLQALRSTENCTVWNYSLTALTAFLISCAVTVYGLIHARIIRVLHYKLKFPADPSAASIRPSRGGAIAPKQKGQCRIVHLSDLHMGSIVTAHYLRRAVRKVNALHPDYVFITGDLFNHGFVEECKDPEADARVLKEMADAGARVYAVTGNHDPSPDNAALQKFLKRARIILLADQTLSLPEFDLAGRGGIHVNHRPALSSWLKRTSDEKPLILLDHYPDSIFEAKEAGVDLMLSGHTHGGQYFPNDLLVRIHYRKGLLRGCSLWGKTLSIVSQGTGFFQIPIRIGTDSEIICIDFPVKQ